jgi:hypothetical protein
MPNAGFMDRMEALRVRNLKLQRVAEILAETAAELLECHAVDGKWDDEDAGAREAHQDHDEQVALSAYLVELCHR